MPKCPYCPRQAKKVTCGAPECQIKHRNMIRKKHFDKYERKKDKAITILAGAL